MESNQVPRTLRRQQKLEIRFNEYKSFISEFRTFEYYEDAQQFAVQQFKNVEGTKIVDADRCQFILNPKFKLALLGDAFAPVEDMYQQLVKRNLQPRSTSQS